jgi:hypothetical protein
VEDELGEALGSAGVEEDEFAEAVGESGCGAINNLSDRGQKTRGGVVEIDAVAELFGLAHDLTVGAGFYRGGSDFNSRVQFALFDPETRSTIGAGSVSGGFANERTEVDTGKKRKRVPTPAEEKAQQVMAWGCAVAMVLFAAMCFGAAATLP